MRIDGEWLLCDDGVVRPVIVRRTEVTKMSSHQATSETNPKSEYRYPKRTRVDGSGVEGGFC